MKGKDGQQEAIVFNFCGQITDICKNLGATLIKLGFQYGDRTTSPLLLPCHKNQ